MARRTTGPNHEIDFHGPGKHGFVPGQPDLNLPPTHVTPADANSWQEEIANVVEYTGETLNPSDYTQLREAVRYIAQNEGGGTGGGGSGITAAQLSKYNAINWNRGPSIGTRQSNGGRVRFAASRNEWITSYRGGAIALARSGPMSWFVGPDALPGFPNDMVYHSGASATWIVCGNGGFIVLNEDAQGLWSFPISNVTANLRGIAWNGSDPGILLAVGADGRRTRSTDTGQGWASAQTIGGASDHWYAVHYADGRFGVCGRYSGGPTRARTTFTTDGSTFGEIVDHDIGSGQTFGDISYHEDSGFWVVAGSNGTIRTSSDRTSWVDRTTGVTDGLGSIATDGTNILVGGQNGVLLHSENAIDWTRVDFPFRENILGLGYGNGRFVSSSRGPDDRLTVCWTNQDLP